MPKYMIKASYSPEGMKGVMDKGGSARADAIEKLVTGVGGTLEGFYFALGRDDVFVIVDAPDVESMAAVGGTVCSTGVLNRYETIQLLTPDQIDKAADMTVDYTPPGN